MDGDQWFIHQSNAILRRKGDDWIRYDPNDGAIDKPNRVLQSKQGDIYIIGSHRGSAAFACGNPEKWTIRTFPDFSRRLDYRTAFEDRKEIYGLARRPIQNPNQAASFDGIPLDAETKRPKALFTTPPKFPVGRTASLKPTTERFFWRLFRVVPLSGQRLGAHVEGVYVQRHYRLDDRRSRSNPLDWNEKQRRLRVSRWKLTHLYEKRQFIR